MHIYYVIKKFPTMNFTHSQAMHKFLNIFYEAFNLFFLFQPYTINLLSKSLKHLFIYTK
jgi:hypothetical protein